jgi:hypothetical protein
MTHSEVKVARMTQSEVTRVNVGWDDSAECHAPLELTKPFVSYQFILVFFQCSGIRIHRIHMFLGLLDPDPDPLVRGMDPDPAPDLDPSIIMQK